MPPDSGLVSSPYKANTTAAGCIKLVGSLHPTDCGRSYDQLRHTNVRGASDKI